MSRRCQSGSERQASRGESGGGAMTAVPTAWETSDIHQRCDEEEVSPHRRYRSASCSGMPLPKICVRVGYCCCGSKQRNSVPREMPFLEGRADWFRPSQP